MRLREFEHCVHEYRNRIFGFAYYFLGSREDAKDVTQDVLIRFWNHRDEVDAERPLAWLLRVTRNACIDHRRSGRRTYEVNGMDVNQWEAPDVSPAEKFERTEGVRRIEAAIQFVAEPYRSVLILREIQDLAYEEISGAMNMPMNTVKVYLHRGRKMLRAQLREVIDREHV